MSDYGFLSYQSPFVKVPALAFISILGWSQSAPTAKVTCRVVDDIGHQPLSRARVTIAGGSLSQPFTGYTDQDGRCPELSLQSGEYTISTEKSGFFPSPPKSTSFAVSAPSELKIHEIVLVAKRSISGLVQWRSGDPAEKVLVHAMLVRRGRAVLRAGDVYLSTTNERGEYRLEGLQPGRYIPYSYTVAVAALDAKPLVGLPVFYPGSSTPEIASSVDLRNVTEVSRIGLALQEASGVNVEGVVTPSVRFPMGTPVMIGVMIPGNPAQPFAAVSSQVGKPFRLYSIPAGFYNLLLSVQLGGAQPSRTFIPLRVATEPITNLNLAMVESGPIEGIIEMEQESLQQNEQTKRKELVPVPKVSVGGSSQTLHLLGAVRGVSDDNGKFHLDGVVNGESYQLEVRAPADTYVAKVAQGGQEFNEGQLHVTAGGGPVRVLLRKDGGKLEGRVKTKEGKESAGFVALIPRNAASEHVYRSTEAGSDGKFRLTNIAPGEYRLIALERNDEDAYFEVQYIRQFDSRTYPIKVAPNTSNFIEAEIVTLGR